MQTVLTLQVVESLCPDVTHIGKSILIKGELSGSESVYMNGVYMNGELEGSVELRDGTLLLGLMDASAPTWKRATSCFTAEWTETCTAASALS